jgi:hypothetical protein
MRGGGGVTTPEDLGYNITDPKARDAFRVLHANIDPKPRINGLETLPRVRAWRAVELQLHGRDRGDVLQKLDEREDELTGKSDPTTRGVSFR